MSGTINLAAYRDVIAAVLSTGRGQAQFSDERPQGVLLRLDVDYDLGWAAETARVNAEMGMRGCYFVQVGAGLYNAADARGRAALAEIAANGQDIALHYHHMGGPLQRDRLLRELDALRTLAPQSLTAVAWHNPEGDLSVINADLSDMNIPSAYDVPFFVDGCYVSDSNLRNSPQEICAFVQNSQADLVQVLLHPFNWAVGGADMDAILKKTFSRKVNALIEEFSANRVWRDGLGNDIANAIHKADWFDA